MPPMRNRLARKPATSVASVTISPSCSRSRSASWRDTRITGGSSPAGAVAAGTASAIAIATAKADTRNRFTTGTARLLDKLPRPATGRDSMRRAVLMMMLAASAAVFVGAQSEKLDYAMLGRIRDEGLNRSQVMDHVSWLSDVYGPRLTGSPGIQQASEWTMKTFREWGLANVHQERWSFGKGWSLVRFTAHLVEPQIQPLIGFPQEWSSGTTGPVTADVVRAQIATEADFAKYHGTLAGKIVLTQPARAVRMLEGPIILRMGAGEIAEAESTPVPAPSGGGR